MADFYNITGFMVLWRNNSPKAAEDRTKFSYGVPNRTGNLFPITCIYRAADKTLASPTYRCIFFMVRVFRLMLVLLYTGCPRRNVPDFGRVFLMLKYTDTTQNTYVQSWTVAEIMVREKYGLLAGPRIVPVSWQVLSNSVLQCGVKLRQFNSR
jgi:hypothetical protein